ncbi:XdhC/CoxI family protein [Amylibacter kogurei]|uniref:XdhC/CoxI family protein n=1 Tax=Paramylibacter kogurei TaxID=1889778 RepID=A0A2G5K510_9RHOB|nr:XdhC family protein [Amylibacter kogurei]PIB24618.1 XdhC/CoxI family protein [Amylibacter kogurei]
MTQIEHMPSVAMQFISDGRGAALATVISTWGSAPRPAGSQLAISEDGAFFGSVSGGCVEGAVILEAQAAIADGQCRVLDYGVADEEAFAVGLACGGDIKILVEPIGVGDGPTVALITELVKAAEERRAIGYQVNLSTWERSLVTPVNAPDAFAADKSMLDGDTYVGVFNPPLRMAIVGAVHITQSLAAMARMAGYTVYLVDPRDSFATKERFPDDQFIDEWPDDAMDAIGLDPRTAVVTLTHDPKMDNPALERALKSDAFYIGALGSRKTHAKRVAHLQSAGFSESEIAKIHAPIGADIGSKSPAEIAISTMAEITERLRRPETRR